MKIDIFNTKNKYSIIYADPAWRYKGSECLTKNSRLTGQENDVYKTMTDDQIYNMPIKRICENNTLLFLWVVSPKLKEGIITIEKWGFVYSTVGFVWHKELTNPGYYTLSSVELCLIGKKGKIPQPRGSRNELQFLSEEKIKHSRKPHEIRRRINKMFPKQKKIELFARSDNYSLFGEDLRFKNWDIWGNEC